MKDFPSNLQEVFLISLGGKWDIWLILKWINDRYVWGDIFIFRSVKFLSWADINSSNTIFTTQRVMCRMDMEGAFSAHRTAWSFISQTPIQAAFPNCMASRMFLSHKMFPLPYLGSGKSSLALLSWLLFYILTWFWIKAMCLYCHYISVKNVFKLVLNIFPILSVIFNCCNVYYHWSLSTLSPFFWISKTRK